MPKGRAPANETPAQRLIRLTNQRVSKTIMSIRQVAALGSLEPTDQQRQKVFSTLDAEFKAALTAWTEKKGAVATTFKL